MNALAVSSLTEFDACLGAFARIFKRPNVDELATAFVDHELSQVQLNLSALGMSTVPRPGEVAERDLISIGQAFSSRGLTVWGVSATYNTAHPDRAQRLRLTEEAAAFIRSMPTLNPVAATLCTGSRNPDNMWARHPGTATDGAWRDMRESLDVLLAAAEDANVLLAIEPEPGNVIADAMRAIRLVDELGDDVRRIGFILDPANLLAGMERSRHAIVLRDAFERLGDRTVCVHAKDTVPWAQTLGGDGVVNYDYVIDLWDQLPARVPFIIQDASETELSPIRDRLRNAAVAVAVK